MLINPKEKYRKKLYGLYGKKYLNPQVKYMCGCVKMNDIKCSKCGSKNIYTTLNYKVCRRCGHREKVNTIKEEGE